MASCIRITLAVLLLLQAFVIQARHPPWIVPSVPKPIHMDPPEATTKLSMFNAAAIAHDFGADGIAYDSQAYFVTITAGNPPLDMSVFVDTGSSDVWFPSQSLLNTFGIDGYALPISSIDKYANGSVPYRVRYSVDHHHVSFSGTLYSCNYTVGGTEARSVLGLVNATEKLLVPAQGMLGLSGAAASPISNFTRDWSNPAIYSLGWESFGIHLADGFDVNARGSFAPNGVEKGLYEGNFTYEPVRSVRTGDFLDFIGQAPISKDWDSNAPIFEAWEFNATRLTFDDRELAFDTTNSMIVDSGTEAMVLEPSFAYSIYGAFGIDPDLIIHAWTNPLKLARRYARRINLPCDRPYPNVTITSGNGNVYTVTSAQYMMPLKFALRDPTMPAFCIPAIIPGDISRNSLGVPFQKAYYTWHIVAAPEGGGPWLGFAKSV